MSDDELMLALRLYLDGFVDFAVCCVGLVINAMAIVMLLRTGGARSGKNLVNIKIHMRCVRIIDFNGIQRKIDISQIS